MEFAVIHYSVKCIMRNVINFIYIYIYIYIVSGLTYKSRAKWNMLRGIYSAIYGVVNISVSGGYVLRYAGGTRVSTFFYFCHLKYMVRPETFGPYYLYIYIQWRGVPRGEGFGGSTPPPFPKFRRYRWSPRSHEQEEPASRFPFAVHCVLIRL